MVTQIKQLISGATKVLVVTHMRPDFDAIASVSLLQKYLEHSFPDMNVDVVIENPPIGEFEIIPRSKPILWTDDVSQFFADYEVIVVMDTNTPKRVSTNFESLKANKVLLIDHHEPEGTEFQAAELIKFHDPTAASTTQVLLELDEQGFGELSHGHELLMLGLVADTDGLANVQGTKRKVFEVMAKLVEHSNLTIEQIRAKYFSYSKELLELVKLYAANTQFVELNIDTVPDLVVSYVEFDDVSKNPEASTAYKVYAGMFLRKVRGYTWGFTVTPVSHNAYNISLRSMEGGPDVLKLAEALLEHGGGHKYAAGGKITKPNKMAMEIVDDLIVKIKSYYSN